MQPIGTNTQVLLEPPVRIELTSLAYHASVLPLNYGGMAGSDVGATS